MLLISIGSSFAAHSQHTDTICLPVAHAKSVLAAAKERDVLKERVGLLQVDIALVNQRLAIKDSVISDLVGKDINNTAIITAMQEQKAALLDEKKIFNDQLRSYETLIRKQKRKTFWTAAAGVLATGITGYLYLMK